jgi:hypothetical protein
MRALLKSVAGALLLAVLVAASLYGLSDLRHYGQEVLLSAFMLLFFGWPEYLLLVAGHYWLLRSYVSLRHPGRAALVGAGLAPSAWGLGVALGLVETPVSNWELNLLLYSIAGAVYGVSIARLYWRRWQPT